MAHKTAGTDITSESGRATATRLTLSLAAALLVCTDPACTAAHDQAAPADPAMPVAPTDPAASSDASTSDGPNESSGSDHSGGSQSPGNSHGSSDSGDASTTGDPKTDTTGSPGDCEFKPDPASLGVDCAKISRIVPTGVGVSEAHVVRRHLRLEDASGAALGPEFHACLNVVDSECAAAPIALEPGPSRSITALLVRPQADPKANDELVAALANFIDGRPEGEQIGVFRWGATVTQISTPTAEKARLHHLVASGLQPLDGDSLPIADAFEAIADPLIAIERNSHLSLRQLLVVAPGHAPLAPGALELGGDRAHLRVELIADAETDAALLDASTRLDAALAAGELLLRHCGLDYRPGLVIHTAGGGPTLALTDVLVPGADQAQAPLVCDPTDQGPTPTLPEVISIDLSATELLDYKARLADLSKEPFFGSVRTNLNAPGVHARVKLKLHGQGSLKCERKSISLNFTDDLARQWLPDSGLDRFVLISMCKDDRYINQHTANLLMAQLGLLAPKFRMVELVISGESHGAYLLIEKPETMLKRGTTRARMIIRRGADIEGDKPALGYAVDDEVQALATYETLISQAEALAGDKLVAWLDQTMDLQQYLRWISLMSLLESGDFIDEVYFMSTEITGSDASVADYFSISTWDQDDIFKTCHSGGLNAILDPNGLLNCVEGRLDHAIFDDPEVYERFAEELAKTLDWLDQATFDAATHASETRVLEILARDGARAAMVELLDDNPAAIAYDVAKEEVLARGAELRKRFAKRRALLIDLLAAYGV
jgi:hypothetical protein